MKRSNRFGGSIGLNAALGGKIQIPKYPLSNTNRSNIGDIRKHCDESGLSYMTQKNRLRQRGDSLDIFAMKQKIGNLPSHRFL